jgi:hypothetical protein
MSPLLLGAGPMHAIPDPMARGQQSPSRAAGHQPGAVAAVAGAEAVLVRLTAAQEIERVGALAGGALESVQTSTLPCCGAPSPDPTRTDRPRTCPATRSRRARPRWRRRAAPRLPLAPCPGPTARPAGDGRQAARCRRCCLLDGRLLERAARRGSSFTQRRSAYAAPASRRLLSARASCARSARSRGSCNGAGPCG